MKAHHIVVIIIAVSLLNLGCHYASTIGPAYDADRPVMLGKVQTIGGATKQLGIKKNSFDVSQSSGHWEIGVNKAFWNGDLTDSTDEYDKFKKKVDAPDNMIKVDKVYFRSFCYIFVTIILLNVFSYHSATGIRGSIYAGNSTDKIENTVDVRRALGGEP